MPSPGSARHPDPPLAPTPSGPYRGPAPCPVRPSPVRTAVRLAIEPFRHRKVNRLIKAAEPEAAAAGSCVYRAGDVAEGVLLVASGYLSLHAPTAGGPEPGHAVALALPGELAGLEALLRGKTERPWTAVAGAGLEIRRLPAGRLRRALRTSETTLDSLLAGSLAGERLRSVLVAGPPAAARLAHVLADLAARGPAPESDHGEGGDIPHRIPHRILADLAGIHRSTATTVLNEWLYRGLLEALDPGWRIPDAGALTGG